MRSEFAFHQALFGYDSGHHLLASSVQLSSELRHMLAIATDLSGSAPPKGFESAFTGLPLAGTNYYALFCTWLAPEVHRPGCVWSQVLFLELADFGEIADLGELRHVFNRPALGGWEEYRKQPKLVLREKAPSMPRRSERVDAERILCALYGAPSSSVVFPAKEASNAEDLVFSLWSQQWPRLRRNFRFSTGSFSDRGRGGAPFDLQVTPESNRRAWQRKDSFLMLDDSAQDYASSRLNSEAWIEVAIKDLLDPEFREFRSFLRTFGIDVNDSRSAFAQLGSIFSRTSGLVDQNWTEMLDSVGETFADPSDALTLKTWLVTCTDWPSNLDRAFATVAFVLARGRSKAYSNVAFDFGGVAPHLWKSRRKEVLSILANVVREDENPASTAFAAAVSKVVVAGELKSVLAERPELLQLLFVHSPQLAFSAETWQLPENTQWRIYEVIDGLSLEEGAWGDVLAAMLVTGSNVAVRDVVRKAGRHAIDGALRWLEKATTQERLPSQQWREALAMPAAERLGNSDMDPPAALALCAWFLLPQSVPTVLSASRSDIQRLASQPLKALPSVLRLYSAFLLVTVGLRAGNAGGVQLVARGFFQVYEALASGDYPWESWQMLAPVLPYVGFWREWDRCEKLRRAVRERFASEFGSVLVALRDAAFRPEHQEIVGLIGSGMSAGGGLDDRLL
jgi:hypothetical protein